ncbi:hypothetical protein AQUSIP_11220 [Aquicella siphonis]|uniref:Uncharacterized protein n=1 Tax=Aquicella siphonis TaxID=254247 RepID=A0A5E4PGW6_9COXI|nr:hypothetical protein [Aquicella siphonis]VVC75825.1 hypothetical protein AQUSIP_11220 [Aquicella siphonis]
MFLRTSKDSRSSKEDLATKAKDEPDSLAPIGSPKSIPQISIHIEQPAEGLNGDGDTSAVKPTGNNNHDKQDGGLRGRITTSAPLSIEKKSRRRSLSPLSRAESIISISPKHTFGSLSIVRSPTPERKPYSQSIFAPITNRVYNAATLYNLLIDSVVKSTQKVTSYPAIPDEDMLTNDVDSLDDNQIFQLGFTRKYCSYTLINHASLAFRDPVTGKFLIVGRQNEQFLKPDPGKPSPSFLWWAISNVMDYHAIMRFTTTRMDNEKKYDFFPGTPFNAEMTEVTMTGAEIKSLVKAIDENICLAQYYDVVHSNCYSSVLFGLAKAFEMIAAKVDDESEIMDDEDRLIANNKDLKRLFTLICSALQDNYKLGSGGINNTVVNSAIQKTIDILEERNLLHIIDSTFIKENKSADAEDREVLSNSRP